MGLIRLNCLNCSTVFYGVLGRDTYCHICKTIIEFSQAFELKAISVEAVTSLIREPKFNECHDVKELKDIKDWRNYIPVNLKAMWDRLPIESRVLAIMFAKREAEAVEMMGSAIAKEIRLGNNNIGG